MFEIAVQIRAITEDWLIFIDPRAVAPNLILISNTYLSAEYSFFSSTYDFFKKMHPRIACMAAYLILSSSTGRSCARETSAIDPVSQLQCSAEPLCGSVLQFCGI